MKVFDPHSFLNSCATAYQAQEISRIADEVLRRASFVLYGVYENKEYTNFTSKQKPGDTHVLLGYAPKRMASPIDK